jgi:hypothetical protein
MVTEIAPITFGYSHTIGRQENRSGNGFFYPVAITRDQENRLYVVSRGSETPAFFPCKRVTVFTVDEELVREFGTKVPPEEADDSAPDGSLVPNSRTSSSSTVNTVTRLQGKNAGVSEPRLTTYSRFSWSRVIATG